MVHVKSMEAAKIMEDMDTTATSKVTAVEEDVVHKTTRIGAEAVEVEPTVILHIAVGHTECVPIQVKAEGHHKMATKKTRYGKTSCWEVKETAPGRLGRYLIVKLM